MSSTDRGQKKIFFFFFDRSYVKKHLVVFGLFQVEISEGTCAPCSEVSRWVWKNNLFFFNTLKIYFLWKERIFTMALVFVKKINFELWSFSLKNNFFLKTSTTKSYVRHKYDNRAKRDVSQKMSEVYWEIKEEFFLFSKNIKARQLLVASWNPSYSGKGTLFFKENMLLQ